LLNATKRLTRLTGYLPKVHIADKATRELKESLRYRMNLIKDHSKTIFRLKALLDKLGLQATGDFTTNKALENIDFTVIPGGYHPLVKKYIEQLKWYREKVYGYYKDLRKVVSRSRYNSSNLHPGYQSL